MKDKYISKRKRFWAEIDMNAAEKNFNIIKSKLASNTKLCCVVKANAYGHGAVYLSKLYESLGADFFAVSNIEEAMQLRNNGIKTPILILGYTPTSCATILAENNISQSVFSYSYASELSKCAKADGVNVKIHIKLDSGMGRIGFDSIHEASKTVETIADVCNMGGLIPEGIFTHFALADDGVDGAEFTRIQYERFTSIVNELALKGIHFEIKHKLVHANPTYDINSLPSDEHLRSVCCIGAPESVSITNGGGGNLCFLFRLECTTVAYGIALLYLFYH